MSLLGILLLVVFIISAVLLILIVMIQDEQGEGIGGLFGGGSSTPFGSRSGNVLTKVTSVLGAIFIVVALALALVNTSGTKASDIYERDQSWNEELFNEEGIESEDPVSESSSFDDSSAEIITE